MRDISRIALVVFALAAVVSPSLVAAAPAAGDVIVMRYGWAPLFCYSGSNSPVPREFCGLTPPALERFNAHRALRLVYYDKTGASPKTCTAPEYNPSAIPSDVRNALHCTGNSYTNGNDDGWWQFVWNEAGKCVSEKTGMDTGKYYTLQNDAFKKYDVDAALKKANYDVTKMPAVDPKKVLDILQKAFGYRGFYTCDNETKANWSTVSICLSPLPPYNITKCPANLIKPNTKCKSGNLKINTEHGGPVSAACLPYYPSFKTSVVG